jgi:ketosteroid isomerase-like protein
MTEISDSPSRLTPAHTANADVVWAFFRAIAAGEAERGCRTLLDPDVRWTVPGHHPLAGTHVGPVEVLALFGRLGRSRFGTEMRFLAQDGDRVVEVHRGWSGHGDGSDIDLLWSMMFTVRDGRIVSAQGFVSDQAAADLFFTRHNPLRPLPDRLDGGSALPARAC